MGMQAATVAVQISLEGAMPLIMQHVQQMQQQQADVGGGGVYSPPDTFDFKAVTSEPTPTEVDTSVNTSEIKVVKYWDLTYSDGSVDSLAINPIDPNADGSRSLKYDFGGIEI
jgi:hypothetical protein